MTKRDLPAPRRNTVDRFNSTRTKGLIYTDLARSAFGRVLAALHTAWNAIAWTGG